MNEKTITNHNQNKEALRHIINNLKPHTQQQDLKISAENISKIAILKPSIQPEVTDIKEK